MPVQTQRTVALVTLGCTRNEVDSEELAGRLADGGWTLVGDVEDADVAVVNTCGFIEQAKKDSIDVILEASEAKETGRTQAVVAVGCLAQRYGTELAKELPEADAVLGFDSYADMSAQPPRSSRESVRRRRRLETGAICCRSLRSSGRRPAPRWRSQDTGGAHRIPHPSGQMATSRTGWLPRAARGWCGGDWSGGPGHR